MENQNDYWGHIKEHREKVAKARARLDELYEKPKARVVEIYERLHPVCDTRGAPKGVLISGILRAEFSKKVLRAAFGWRNK